VAALLNQAYGYRLYFNPLRPKPAKPVQIPEKLRQTRTPAGSPQIDLLP
jgi:hypothetical protein